VQNLLISALGALNDSMELNPGRPLCLLAPMFPWKPHHMLSAQSNVLHICSDHGLHAAASRQGSSTREEQKYCFCPVALNLCARSRQLPRPCTSSYTYVNPGRAYKLLSKALSERHNKAKLGNWGCVRRAIWLAHDLQAQGKTRSAGSMSYASFHRTAPHSRKPWCLATTW
jgi:hypothetical protein